MGDPGIGTYVRYWLHYSNLSSSFYKQYGAAKKVKDDYESQIIEKLKISECDCSNMSNPSLGL
jgi:hypothetical protein